MTHLAWLYMGRVSLLWCMLVPMLLQPLAAVEVLDGDLTVTAPTTPQDSAATLAIELSFVAKDTKKPLRTLADRTVAFYCHPYRYSPFLSDAEPLAAKPAGAGKWQVVLPACAPGWYYLSASVSTIDGEIPGGASESDAESDGAELTNSTLPSFDLDRRNPRAGSAIICVRAAGGVPAYRVHTERGRCVFAQGEQFRVYASVRGRTASDKKVTMQLAEVTVAEADLAAAAATTATIPFDLPAELTAGFPAGQTDLVLFADGHEVDRLPIQIMVPAPASARARWWHGFPFGMGSANNGDPIQPRLLHKYQSWIEGTARDGHHANLWVNWFSDSTPVMPTITELPAIDAADAPPAVAEQRPAAIHALYESLMAEGMACGAMLGGAEGGSENYCPFPTVDPEKIALVARKYQQAAQSLASHPNFTAVYMDAYGRPDWHGKGGNSDLSDDEANEARKLMWDAAWKAASAKPPVGAEITLPKLPEDMASAETRLKFLDYVMRGQERMYGAATRSIEAVLPAVFTIHNHNRENHRQPFVYAFQDWSRSPSIAPDFLQDAATVIASSEWNLDAEPQPYLLSAETNRVLLDHGRPVWRTAAFHFNGSSDRFLRDAVHLSGRGMTPFYEQPESATWSFQGADQSAYAAKDRLAAVTEFLTTYEGLFAQLEPVREVAFYLRPGWGDENSLSMITGLPAAMMTGHQAHALTISGLLAGDLAQYKILFAPGLTGPFAYPAEAKAVQDWVAKGGTIIGAPAGTGRYADLIDLTKYGITVTQEPEMDKNGKPKVDKDGKPVIRTIYDDPLPARAAATKAAVWKDFPKTTVLPVDFTDQYAYTNDEGEQVGYSKRSHWTGFQMWANAAIPALANSVPLKAAFDAIEKPLIVKDQPEVLIHALRPKESGASGLFLFAANFTVPKEPSWTSPRVPYFFWPTYSAPVHCQVGIRDDGVGVVYDLMTAKPVAIERRDGRVWFDIDLTQLAGRVYACYPDSVRSGTLTLPTMAKPGQMVQGTWETDGAGKALTSVRVRLLNEAGTVLTELNRAVGRDGKLPVLDVPRISGTLGVEVLDTITGLQATAKIAVVADGVKPVAAAPAVTVFRGDAIHQMLKAGNIRLAVCPGREVWDKDGRHLSEANPQLARDRAAADRLRSALVSKGITVEIADPTKVVADELSAYPFSGRYRSRHTIPNRRIEGPVIVIGSTASNAWLADMERAQVAPRSIGSDNVGGGRAVVAYAPRAFATDADAILLVADDDAGFTAATAMLVDLALTAPKPDAFYQAREAVRASFTPSDVLSYKTSKGVVIPQQRFIPLAAQELQQVAGAASDYRGSLDRLGPAVFTLNASEGGVAVSLASLGTPAVLVSAAGKVMAQAGGPGHAWARDVGISADGKTMIAGLALSAETLAIGDNGKERWRHVSGVVQKDDIFGWETWKDSERFLVVSPDHSSVLVSAGPEGIVCHDLKTGAVRWTLPSVPARDRPLGIACEQLAVSPDGGWGLVYQQTKTGETAVLDKSGKQRIDADGTPMIDEQFEKRAVLVDMGTGKPRWTAAMGATGDWDLYTALGPQAEWNLVASRGGRIAVRDRDGALLRAYTLEQLPAEFAGATNSIPMMLMTGLPRDQFLLARAETKTMCVMDVKIGSPAQRAASIAAMSRLEGLKKTLGDELQSRDRQKVWNNDNVDTFLATLALPDAAKRLVGEKMKRFSAEARAGRKRDYRWIQDEFTTAMQMAFEAERQVIEAACGLPVRRQIALPAKLHHAVASSDLRTVYAGLWDGTVRAYDTESGAERWRTEVVGGCQLDLTGDTLYAGGSRGGLWQMDAKTGAIRWRLNLAAR